MLILSLFPGIDLLGRGFEAEGFCVVRGPDLLWGGDVRAFTCPPGRFDGVISGSPCQDFSRANRGPKSQGGYSVAMLVEFARLITEGQPDWFLLENVPTVPDVAVEGYTVQRFDLNARECGSQQRRLRHFQFGSRDGLVIVPLRTKPSAGESQPTCLATDGVKKRRRTFADFCELQGLPRNFNLPGYSVVAKYRAVGNGVHVGVARVIARAIKDAAVSRVRYEDVRLCACGCGRICSGRKRAQTDACRKRMQMRRERELAGVGVAGPVTESLGLPCGIVGTGVAVPQERLSA